MTLRYTLRADGPSDEMLVPILNWALQDSLPAVELHAQFADPRLIPSRLKKGGIAPSIQWALECFPCDVLFVHRDAEGSDPIQRVNEIREAVESLTACASMPHIRVIPVRMSEAWLLFDEAALRRAAGNPNGKAPLDLPKVGAIETIAEPKQLLHQLLRDACGLHGRRRKGFKPEKYVLLISKLISDFSPLKRLEAFNRLLCDISDFTAAYSANADTEPGEPPLR